MLMKIKKLRKNFIYPKSSGSIDYSNPHVKSEPNRRNSLKENLLDGRTDGQTDAGASPHRKTDAGASPHRTVISASSILVELTKGPWAFC